jgi:FtsH-binding integral membrane protein
MKDDSLFKLGGICAILLGVAKIFSSGIYLTLAPDLRAEVPAAKFLPAFAQNSSSLITFFWIEAFVGVLGLAVIPALSSVVKPRNEGWVRWAGTLAYAGFVITAVGYTLSIARLPAIAKAFVAGDIVTKAVLAAVWKSSIDLYGLWGYGAVGFWVLVVSVLATRSNELPKFQTYLGILLAVLFLLVPVGAISKNSLILLVAAAGGLVISPIWWIWTGLTLRSYKAT